MSLLKMQTFLNTSKRISSEILIEISASKRMDSEIFREINDPINSIWLMNSQRRRGLNAAHKSHIARLLRNTTRIQKSLQYFRRRCTILETILADIDRTALPPKSASQQENFFSECKKSREEKTKIVLELPTAEPFYRLLAAEMLENSGRHPNGRRWSFPFLMLSFVARSLGSKGYDYFRQFIAMPTKQTLLNHFGAATQTWAECLVDVAKMSSICDLFRRRYRLDDLCKPEVVIGVDAMTIEPVAFPEASAHVGDNHVFLFELLPLSCEFKPFSLHVMTQRGGNAGQAVLNRLDEIRSELTKYGFCVRCLASDGDRGYDALHREMQSRWFSKFTSKGVEKALKSIKKCENRVVSDFLHLLKNARSRMINGRVSLFGTGICPFKAADMNEKLALGAALTDNTSKGRMRDSYALQIFTLENFLRLVNSQAIHMAFYILPYALWNSVVNNAEMSCQMRREFLVTCLEIFTMYMTRMRDVDSSVVSINKNNGELIQFACSENHARRALNTLIVLLMEIERHPDDLALDRLGTHPLECRFGSIRMLCRSKHCWKRVHRAFSTVVTVNDMTTVLGRPIVVRERVNLGGVKINGETGGIYVEAHHKPIEQVYEDVAAVLSNRKEGILDTGTTVDVTSEIADFVNYIGSFVECCRQCGARDPKLYHGTQVSNTTIMARLIAFCRNSGGLDCDDMPVETDDVDYSKCILYDWQPSEIDEDDNVDEI